MSAAQQQAANQIGQRRKRRGKSRKHHPSEDAWEKKQLNYKEIASEKTPTCQSIKRWVRADLKMQRKKEKSTTIIPKKNGGGT